MKRAKKKKYPEMLLRTVNKKELENNKQEFQKTPNE
jgi:hypothetical protein